MENNQQRKHEDPPGNKTSTSLDNKQDAQQNVSDSETANQNRFAETPGGEQHSESGKPEQNKTLGTP